MRKTAITLLLLLTLVKFLAAQKDIAIGKSFTMHSSVLSEEREYFVSLPADYDDSKYAPARYPVIYVLDGELGFQYAVGMQQHLSRGPYANTPRSIIVGIVNTQRTRDLTPALPPSDTVSGKLFGTGGGNEAFIQFMVKELMPAIDSNFRTSGYNVLAGHSFGGLTATNILLHHTALFNAYIIIDPSLWWGQQMLLAQAEQILKTKDFASTSVFVAQANHEADAKNTPTDMQIPTRKFADLLGNLQPKGLRHRYQYYPNEDHGTIPIPAVYDGLRFLFDGHLVPVRPAIAKPEMVTQQFEKLSKQLGFRFQPSEHWLHWMGNFALSNKNKNAAIAFYKMAIKLYPQSENVKRMLQTVEN